MELIHSVKAKNQKTKDYLDKLFQSDGRYIKDGNVFQKTEQGIIFLGPLSKAIPEKCQGCEFLIKKVGSDILSVPDQSISGQRYEGDDEIFWKGGCILRECVEEIIRERRTYAVSSHRLTEEGKKMLKSAWSDKR